MAHGEGNLKRRMSVTKNDISSFLNEAVGLDIGLGRSDFFDEVHRSYVASNHIERLALAYACVLRDLPDGANVVIAGGHPLEGAIVLGFRPACRLRMFGLAESTHAFVGRGDVRTSVTGAAARFVVRTERLNLESSPLPVDAESCDAAISLEVIEHLKHDPLFFMGQLNRALVPGGRLFVSTPNLCSARALRRGLLLESPLFFPPYFHPKTRWGIAHTKEYAVLELLGLLERTGFRPERLDTFDHPSTSSFDHDRRYRARGTVSEGTLERLGLVPRAEGVAEQAIAELLRHDEHPGWRGDYLLVQSTRSSRAEPEPYLPLFDADA